MLMQLPYINTTSEEDRAPIMSVKKTTPVHASSSRIFVLVTASLQHTVLCFPRAGEMVGRVILLVLQESCTVKWLGLLLVYTTSISKQN